MNAAMGKWISTTCCACFASATVLTSNGLVLMMPHSTTTVPVIFGWIEQKYGKAPDFVKVTGNLARVSSTLDLNALSVCTTACGMSSRLIHVTVVPTGTFSSAGSNVKLSILISADARAGADACG